MRGRTITIAVTAALLTALAPPAAWGDGRSARDRNDAPGPLDIARISHAHRGSAASGVLVHTMRLHRAWPVKKLRGNAFAIFYFDLRGRRGAGAERTVQVQYENGRLVAHMFDQVDAGGHVGAVTLRRPDRRTIRVSFPKSMLRKGLHSYKWNVATLVETPGGRCRAPGCIDWAPHGRKGLRYLRHAL